MNDPFDRIPFRNGVDPAQCIRALSVAAHQTAYEHGWWDSDRTTAEALLKITVEVAEAVQALEAGDPRDKHLPEFRAFSVELADIVIRVLDLAAAVGVPLGEAVVAKMRFNETRPYRHGKEF